MGLNARSVMEFLSCNEEEFEYLKRTCTPGSKTAKFINLTSEELSLIDFRNDYLSTAQFLRKRLSLYREEKGKTLREITGYPEDIFDMYKKKYLNRLRKQSVLQVVFGNDLDQVKDASKLNYKNLEGYSKSLSKFKKYLKILSDKLKIEASKSKPKEGGEILPKKEEPRPEILLAEDHSTPFDLNNEFIKMIVKKMPTQYRLVLELSLGTYDGKSYPNSDIAILLGTTEDDVIARKNKGRLLLEELLASFKATIDSDLSKMFAESSNTSLLREKPKGSA